MGTGRLTRQRPASSSSQSAREPRPPRLDPAAPEGPAAWHSLEAIPTDTLAVVELGLTTGYTATAEPFEMLWLHADLGTIPDDGDEAPTFLLEVGRAGWALGRMTVGLDQDGRKAFGYTSIPVALLDKRTRRIVDVPLEYRGFEVGDEFLLGYGLDWDGRFRNLPSLWAVLDLAEYRDDPDLLAARVYPGPR